MKKSLSILFALTLTLPVAAFAQGTLKIGTVDMQRAFKDYNKTKEAEAKINDAKNSAKKEYDDRAEAYKKSLDEINNLNRPRKPKQKSTTPRIPPRKNMTIGPKLTKSRWTKSII